MVYTVLAFNYAHSDYNNPYFVRESEDLADAKKMAEERFRDLLNMTYEREWQLQPSFLTLDFYLTEIRAVIEFHGRIHGQLKQEQREQNDAKKRELLADAGIETLWIDHTEMSDIEPLIEKIRTFLKGRRDGERT